MKLTQVFTALVTLTFISAVQAGYCYCQYYDFDNSKSTTKECCLQVMGTDELHHVFLGKDIYCDTGSKSGFFKKCCNTKEESMYCR